jgi:hypothetical protein
MLQRSITKSSQVLSMCFQAFESHTKQTYPSLLMFTLCQDIRSTNFDHLYILSMCGIRGKWQKTLQGTLLNPSTKQSIWHFRHVVIVLASPQNRTWIKTQSKEPKRALNVRKVTKLEWICLCLAIGMSL